MTAQQRLFLDRNTTLVTSVGSFLAVIIAAGVVIRYSEKMDARMARIEEKLAGNVTVQDFTSWQLLMAKVQTNFAIVPMDDIHNKNKTRLN